jgi:hypothetical protein
VHLDVVLVANILLEQERLDASSCWSPSLSTLPLQQSSFLTALWIFFNSSLDERLATFVIHLRPLRCWMRMCTLPPSKSSSSYSTLPVLYDIIFELYFTKYYVLFYWEDNVFQFKLFTSRGQTWAVAVWSTRLPTVSGRDSDRLEHLGNVLEVGNSITSLHKP